MSLYEAEVTNFHPKELLKFSRFIRLNSIGEEGFKKLSKSKIGIFGMGGLGSWSSLLLVQLNVSYLRIVDRDVVELSNLPRTPIYTSSSVDLPKVEEAKKFLTKINSEVEIDARATNIDEFTIDSLVEGLDLIIDGLDTFSTRYIINKACLRNNIPFVFAGAVGTSCNISSLTYTDDSPCLECFYGSIDDEQLPTCDVTGVHTAILSICASIQVSEAIRIIISNDPILISKMAYFDLNTYDLDIITIKKNPQCQICKSNTKKSKYILDNSIEMPKSLKIIELCGKDSYSMASIPRKPINIELVTQQLKSNPKVSIKKSGSLGVTFTVNEADLTIFRGGNVLLRNVKSKKEATELYSNLLKSYFNLE